MKTLPTRGRTVHLRVFSFRRKAVLRDLEVLSLTKSCSSSYGALRALFVHDEPGDEEYPHHSHEHPQHVHKTLLSVSNDSDYWSENSNSCASNKRWRLAITL